MPLSDVHLPQFTADTVPEPIPPVVRDKLRIAFPDEIEEILKTLRWSHTNGCFYFIRWGLFVGVETDGFIHS